MLHRHANSGIHAEALFVEQHHTAFGERADGEFALTGMAELADDENVERTLKFARHFGGDHHSSARQAGHLIHFDCIFTQATAQPASRILARRERHVP